MNVSQALASAMLTAAGTQFNNGTLVFYSGTQPTTPETALSGNTVLVTFTFSATAFGTPTYSSPNEQTAASFVSTSVSPAAAGTVTFARGYTSGSVAQADFTVGTSATDIIIGNTAIQTGVPVTLSSFLLKQPAL